MAGERPRPPGDDRLGRQRQIESRSDGLTARRVPSASVERLIEGSIAGSKAGSKAGSDVGLGPSGAGMGEGSGNDAGSTSMIRCGRPMSTGHPSQGGVGA